MNSFDHAYGHLNCAASVIEVQNRTIGIRKKHNDHWPCEHSLQIAKVWRQTLFSAKILLHFVFADFRILNFEKQKTLKWWRFFGFNVYLPETPSSDFSLILRSLLWLLPSLRSVAILDRPTKTPTLLKARTCNFRNFGECPMNTV